MPLTKTKLKEMARQQAVTEHASYQSYLAFLYAEAKVIDPSYSYIRFSEDLGLGSANAHSVIHGRRPLTEKGALKICIALGLSGVQKKYFLALVDQQRAESSAEREAALAQRLAIRQSLLPTELDRKKLAFFEHWYHSAILELLRLDHAQDNAAWIADHISPQVPKSQIQESLDLMVELGYLQFDERHQRLYPSDVTITTGNEVLGLALLSYHNQMLKLAMGAMETVDREHRDISAITVAVSEDLAQQFKDEIIALRKRFLQLSAEAKEATDVLQINFQLFPLVKKKGSP